LCQLLVELGRRDLARPLATTLVTHGSGDGRVRLAWLSLLGGILVDDRDFEAALPVLGRLRSEARQAGDKTILSVCLGDLALCANRLGNPAGALVYHAEEESQCRSAGDMVGLGECLGNFALDLLAAGQANEALARWGEQEQIARRWNQDAMLCLSLRGQARALIALRDISRVFGLLEEAGAHHREAGEVRELRQCRLLTAEARAVGGDADEAFRLCQELESEAAAADDLEGVVEARIAVGRLFLALNRPGAAARMAGLAARTAASIGDLDIRARFLVAACAIASQAKPLS